ncbi:glutathione S-transferase family protein [Calothrix sp. PCC 7507]|uniref:glutathione S-transferase family protein n=1 Tax=Calothrix sp. PCC 7507 TaxID=99598 RepID=UPI00029F3E3E|nr:glutathione S-transferase N-terminal domain-containing protein [Calothrix sp. PCC 7507]AFY31050.1 Glutathione S-transferase domain protein [Calothrix sp. PCC 7507]
MKLFSRRTSQYARIARVAIIELDLVDRVELQEVTIRDRHSEILNYNPAGKVPTLATDDGFILSETPIIVHYLNRLKPEVKLVADYTDEFSLHLEGITTAFIDGISTWTRERRFRSESEQSPGIIELERSRALRILDYFEKIADKLDQTPKLAHITLASALGLEIRLPELQWRPSYPKLAQWYDQFSERPSLQATTPES